MATQRFEELDKLLKVYRRNPQSKIFAPLAEMYRKNGLVDEALSLCERGLSFHPDYCSGKLAYAKALFDSGEVRRAVGVLEEVTTENPRSLMAHKILKSAYEKLGMQSKLDETKNTLGELDPYSEGGSEMVVERQPSQKPRAQQFEVKSLGDIFKKKDFEFEEGTQKEQDQKKHYTVSLAQLYERQKHFAKAAEVYESLCQLYPDKEDFKNKFEEMKSQTEEPPSSQVALLQGLLKNVQKIQDI